MIKNAVYEMGGTVKEDASGSLICKWRSPHFRTIFPSKTVFYIGNDQVRAVCGKVKPLYIHMRIPLRGIYFVWNRFLETIMCRHPDVDFGVRTGDMEIVAAQFLGEAIEEVRVSTTQHSPSIAGAIIGGELFGDVGAIIGSTYGESHTTERSYRKLANGIFMRVRYSNGMITEGEVVKNSPDYHEILGNLHRLSEHDYYVPAPTAQKPLEANKRYIASEKQPQPEDKPVVAKKAEALPPQKKLTPYELQMRNAVRTAESYLDSDYQTFSQQGLIEQLEYEKFDSEIAKKAVNGLQVDWKKQAAKCAQSYMDSDLFSFSPGGLYDQLVHEGFTAEEAEFGVHAAGY